MTLHASVGIRTLRATACALFVGAALLTTLADAAVARGARGGGRMAQSSVLEANRASTMDRGIARSGSGNLNGNAIENRSGNRTKINDNDGNRTHINVGNDVDVDIDIDNGWGHDHIGDYHPVAAGIAIGAVAATTAAAVGAYYYALPPTGCTVVYRNGVSYHHCGSVYYQRTWVGSDVVYVVVTLP